MGPPLLPTARGSRASCRSCSERGDRGPSCPEQGSGPAPEAAGSPWGSQTHEAPRAGSGSAPLLGLEAWLWIPLRSRRSAGTRALCAWSSVPAYSTHLLLFHWPAKSFSTSDKYHISCVRSKAQARDNGNGRTVFIFLRCSVSEDLFWLVVAFQNPVFVVPTHQKKISQRQPPPIICPLLTFLMSCN